VFSTGLIQRGGQVVIRMLANVQQKTIQPIIETAVTEWTRIHTDEYDIYARLSAWGYRHEMVCHAQREFARNEDGDRFCEIHVNIWRARGPYCAPGSARTGVSRKRSCRCISAPSRSYITLDATAKPSWAPSSQL
jgi:hypothetical protein